MDTQPWKISVISTDNDLHDLREALITHLKEIGYSVIAFEDAGFPVEPGIGSHRACLAAIDTADIVVLIIDKRYGGTLHDGEGSITEAEFHTAIEKGKIIIPCVREKTWEAKYHLQSVDKSVTGGIRETYEPCYVQNWEIFDFIDLVRNHHTNPDNYLVFFDGPSKLISQLDGRLMGLTRFLLGQLVMAQVDFVRAQKTTTGMVFSLGDVIDRGYFTEPPYKIQSGSVNRADASQIVGGAVSDGKSIAILGGPGSGKSTLIAKLFIELGAKLLHDSDYTLPLYIQLRGRGADYHFDISTMIIESFAAILGKGPFPSLDFTHVKFILFIDGMDELTEDVVSIDMQGILKSSMFSYPLVLSCRSRLADDYLSAPSLGSKFSIVMELQPWDLDTAIAYLERFCNRPGHIDRFTLLQEALRGTPEMQEIAANPLLLTLFLWIVEANDMSLPLDLVDRITLYDVFLEKWAARDLARLLHDGAPIGRTETETLYIAWQIAAWRIYQSRFNYTLRLYIDDLVDFVVSNVHDQSGICKKEAFTSLFDIREHTGQVVGMLHEQMLEHLIGRSVAEGMRSGIQPFPECLGFIIRPEINRIIRQRWVRFKTEDVAGMLDRLWAQYQHALHHSPESHNSIMLRNQCLYYVGRIETPESIMRLQEATKLEQDWYVLLTIYFGLIKKLDFAAEEQLFTQLAADSNWDAGNRGYHLVYYRDWAVVEIQPPYIDPGNIPWEKTLSALMRHIESNEVRHAALMRVELYTIRRLIETRQNTEPIDDIMLERIRKAVAGLGLFRGRLPDTFITAVGTEMIALQLAYESAKTPKAVS